MSEYSVTVKVRYPNSGPFDFGHAWITVDTPNEEIYYGFGPRETLPITDVNGDEIPLFYGPGFVGSKGPGSMIKGARLELFSKPNYFRTLN